MSKKVDNFDKNFKEVIANFIGIETVCLRCNSSFSFKLQLYKHLKAGCIGVVQATLLSLTQFTLLIFIVELKAIVPSLRSGLVF